MGTFTEASGSSFCGGERILRFPVHARRPSLASPGTGALKHDEREDRSRRLNTTDLARKLALNSAFSRSFG